MSGHPGAASGGASAGGAPAGAPPGAHGPPGSMGPLSPPYPPMYAALGGIPNTTIDVPIVAVFFVLFFTCALGHMAMFQRNRLMLKHKFIFSAAMFAFCIIRLISCGLRIAWAHDNYNIKLGIAAQIFVQAGTVILFIINLFFAQRLMRARHPHIGWSTSFTAIVPPFCIFLIISGLIMVIAAVVQSFYTLDLHTHKVDHDIQLYVVTMFAALAFIPIPLISIMLMIPRRTYLDKFGYGHFKAKVILLIFSSAVLTLGASFRAAVAWMPAVPLPGTAWYLSKQCFYCFNFMLEFIVVFSYLVVRVDKRFHIVDGAKGPGGYSGDVVREKDHIQWPRSLYQSHEDLVGSEGSTWEYDEGVEKGDPAVLELDNRSGGWKVRRMSDVGTDNRASMRY